MKKFMFLIIFSVLFFLGCVSTKNTDAEFVGVEKQELPGQYQGQADQTQTEEVTEEPAPITETPVVENPGDESGGSTVIEVSGDESSGDIVVVIDDANGEDVVIETGSPTAMVTVPETAPVFLRSRDADRLGIVFRDTLVLQGIDAASAIAEQYDVSQVVVYLTDGARYQVQQVLDAIKNWKQNTSFYLLVSKSSQIYEYREQIKNTPNIKGVIFWFEYWNYLTYGFKTRQEAFDAYKKELQIVSSVAGQNSLLCYTVIDWFTADELTAILRYQLHGIMLATADKHIRIAEYIENDMQIIRSLNAQVSWGIFIQSRPPDLINLKTDNEIINLLKLYKDDPRFQGIIFMY